MLKNYFKIAYRNLFRFKGYTLINITGLAVGIACFLMITGYVMHELSYDRFHEKSDQLYRVIMETPAGNIELTPSFIAPILKNNYPEVEKTARIYHAGRVQPRIMRMEDKIFEEASFIYADSTFFNLFTFEWKIGTPETALNRPNTMVITLPMAEKYFGNKNPVGESLQVDTRIFEITGVVDPLPSNSHLHADFIASIITLSNWSQFTDESWQAANFITYLQLYGNAEFKVLEQSINEYIVKMGEPYSFYTMKLEPVTRMHLYSASDFGIASGGDIKYVYAASVIALLILIIACINYMNLATARASSRSREVGIRKVLGSDRRNLIGQFYGESFILVFIAVIFSALLVEIFTPWFNNLTGKNLSISMASAQTWLMLAGTIGVVSLIAGSYPALVLSSFSPAAVLKGNIGSARQGEIFRKTLVVFQFAVSIFLIIGTLIVAGQVRFMQDMNPGFNKDDVMVLTAHQNVIRQFDTIKSELSNVRGVQDITMASELPGSINAGYRVEVEGMITEKGPLMNGLGVFPNFTEALGMELLLGELFTGSDLQQSIGPFESREFAFMLNETALQRLGISPETAIGRRVHVHGRNGHVKAVLKDFHNKSLHSPIEPLVVFLTDDMSKVFVTLQNDNMSQTISGVQSVWADLFPGLPFTFTFLDDEYHALYLQEARMMNMFTTFALLAIFIACLGLLGLASFMVERRTREIGVRKVLGATAQNIVGLFSKDVVKLVLIGFVIAVPAAWLLMSRWLEDFAYKVAMDPAWFIYGGIAALLVALITVSFQAVKAAWMNPVKSLRSE